jgi:hypothetical protein
LHNNSDSTIIIAEIRHGQNKKGIINNTQQQALTTTVLRFCSGLLFSISHVVQHCAFNKAT